MNTIVIKFLLYSLCLSFFTGGEITTIRTNHIQTEPKFILDHIGKFYSSHDYIYQELSYHLFADHKSSAPQSIENGVFIKQGDTYYSQLLSIESLTTKEYTIGIDNEEKEIMISNHLFLSPTNPLENIDSWISAKSLIEIKQGSDGLNSLSFKIENGEIEEVFITYDINTYQVTRLVMNYRRSIQMETDTDSDFVKPRLEIEYHKTSFDNQEKERLNINSYLIRKGTQWFLSAKYSDYELINNIRDLPE
ncbi:MAG TPA: hypothetical protein VK590_02775 [Saprospiraceae bacterium]|nr:hypothetical protein [Saprospiraceae bacterium]